MDLIDFISDAIIVVDRQWRITFANRGATHIFGIKPDDLNGMLVWNAAPALQGSFCDTEFRRAMSQGCHSRCQYEDERNNRWFETSLYPFPGGIISLWQDITTRKNTEYELLEMTRKKQESLALLDALFDYAPIGLGFWDENLRFVRTNKKLQEINGLSEDEVVGKTVGETLPRLGGHGELESCWRHVIETGRPMLNVEISGETPASPGVLRHWVDNWYPVKVAGKVIGVAATVMDISELKQTIDALHAKEKRLRLACMASKLGVFEWDVARDKTIWENERMFEIFERSPNDGPLSIKEYQNRIIHPEDVAHFTSCLEESMERGGDFNTECRIASKNGSFRWVAFSGLFDRTAGDSMRLISILTDITKRKLAEETLRRSHNELELQVRERTVMLEATVNDLKAEIAERTRIQQQLRGLSRVFMDSADPIILEDMAGTIMELNLEAEKVYGWSRSDLIGRNINTLIPESMHQLSAKLRTFIKAGLDVRNWETARMDKDGRLIPTLITIFPLTEKSDQALQLASIAKDISVQKKIETDLKASHLKLQEVMRKSVEVLEADRRIVARELHDGIGGSLAAIKFSLEELVEQLGEGSPEVVASLKLAVSHLLETISEGRRIAAYLRPLMLDEPGLLPTIEWYTGRMMNFYKGMKIRLDIRLNEQDVSESEKIVLFRVLQEALNNAARHSGAKTVQVRLRRERNHVLLFIEDNGRGFEMRSVQQHPGSLSGFGIQSMQQRVEICGGTFKLESRSGRGTRIWVKLKK